MKKALITGITGQDGSYLTDFLLEKGYEVHGIVRRSSSFNRGRIEHHYKGDEDKHPNLHLHYGDITDSSHLLKIVEQIKPDEIYNLAAQSHVGISFTVPEYTAHATGFGVLKLLEAVRSAGLIKKTRVYQASTSELFGKAQEIPQSEKTPFHPRSPYGVAKLYAYWIVKNYREAYGLYACNGILFNHESPRRGQNFVSKKIAESLARIKHNKQEILKLGNLNAKRDWGHAKDYVEAMWLMLQQDNPKDYVIGTGETRTVREFVEECGKHLDMNFIWHGEGLEEVGIDQNSGKILVKVDPNYFRPSEVDILLADPTYAKETLGWEPKIKFQELVKIMMDHELKVLNKQHKA